MPGTQPGLAVKCRNARAKGKELVVREPVQVGCRRPNREGCPAVAWNIATNRTDMSLFPRGDGTNSGSGLAI